MGAMRPEHLHETFALSVGTVSSATAPVLGAYWQAHRKFKVESMTLINGAGVVANDTNYVTVSLKNGSTVVGSCDSRAANQGALVANTGKACVVTEANSVIPAGSTLTIDFAKGGTGALTSAVVIVAGYWIETA